MNIQLFNTVSLISTVGEILWVEANSWILLGGLEHEFHDFPIILGMSSSQLTNLHIFQRGRAKNRQPGFPVGFTVILNRKPPTVGSQPSTGFCHQLVISQPSDWHLDGVVDKKMEEWGQIGESQTE